MRGRGVDHLPPPDAGLDPGDPSDRVDVQALHRLVDTKTVPSAGAAAPCPVAWTVTFSPASPAARTAAATSAAERAATTTRAGG